MMNNINRYLIVARQPISSKDKDNSQELEERQKWRLLNCKQIEVNKYVHYLTSEGLGMLLRLQSMELEDQTQFVLSNCESVLDSRHPNVLMVPRIDLYEIGTLEEHSWNPRVDSKGVFGVTSDQWKWAQSFLDDDRGRTGWLMWW